MTRVAIVVLDTLRYDFFEEHFDWIPGQQYTNAWSTSHGTPPAHGSLFTGLYPSEHGVDPKSPHLTISRQTLPEKLREESFTTRAYSANPYISPEFNFDRGFDVFDGSLRVRQEMDGVFDWDTFLNESSKGLSRYFEGGLGALTSDRPFESIRHGLIKFAEGHGLWQPSDSGGKNAIRWVRDQTFSDDEFVFINLMDAHSPYLEVPDSYQPDINTDVVPRHPNIEQVFSPPDPTPVRRAYDSAVQYLSDVYQEIFGLLTSEMDYIITVADHGECLGDQGLWGHSYGLLPELTHIPVVVWQANENQRDKIDEPASLLDVHQTILDVTNSKGESRGESFFDPQFGGNSYLVEYHGLPDRIINRHSEPVEKYDIERRGIITPDGFGYQDVDGWEGTKKEIVQDRFEKLVSDIEPADQKGASSLSSGTMDRLRDLGYA